MMEWEGSASHLASQEKASCPRKYASSNPPSLPPSLPPFLLPHPQAHGAGSTLHLGRRQPVQVPIFISVEGLGVVGWVVHRWPRRERGGEEKIGVRKRETAHERGSEAW